MRLRIVGLGDSTTAGTPAFLSPIEAPPNGRGNPESQYAFWMMRARRDWSVLNRGINGERSDEILARFTRDVLPESPDYVILLAGVNDIYQGFATDRITRNLAAMYDAAIAAGIRPVAATVLPYNTATRRESDAVRTVNRWLLREAESRGVPFCDTNRGVADPTDPDRLRRSPDGLHPDVEGYRAMGEALVAAVESDAL